MRRLTSRTWKYRSAIGAGQARRRAAPERRAQPIRGEVRAGRALRGEVAGTWRGRRAGKSRGQFARPGDLLPDALGRGLAVGLVQPVALQGFTRLVGREGAGLRRVGRDVGRDRFLHVRPALNLAPDRTIRVQPAGEHWAASPRAFKSSDLPPDASLACHCGVQRRLLPPLRLGERACIPGASRSVVRSRCCSSRVAGR